MYGGRAVSAVRIGHRRKAVPTISREDKRREQDAPGRENCRESAGFFSQSGNGAAAVHISERGFAKYPLILSIELGHTFIANA